MAKLVLKKKHENVSDTEKQTQEYTRISSSQKVPVSFNMFKNFENTVVSIASKDDDVIVNRRNFEDTEFQTFTHSI